MGSGRGVALTTLVTDTAYIDTYTIHVKAQTGCSKNENGRIKIQIIHPCTANSLSIIDNGSSPVFTSPAVTYNLGDSPKNLKWDDTIVVPFDNSLNTSQPSIVYEWNPLCCRDPHYNCLKAGTRRC